MSDTKTLVITKNKTDLTRLPVIKTTDNQPVNIIDKLTRESVECIDMAIVAVENLSINRAINKFSNSRAQSVAKELRELRKVLVAYIA